MPFGPRVPERLERRWQRCQLRQQWAQRPGDGAEVARQRDPRRAPEGLEDRTERERLAERLAVADEGTPVGDLGPAEELLDEPGLAHAGLAFDEDDGRRAERGGQERVELALPADEDG